MAKSLNKYSLWLYGCILASAEQYQYLPCVYEKFFILLTLLAPINNLLNESSKKPSWLKVALDALECLIARQETFNEHVLELDALRECIELLFKVSIYASVESRRRASSNLLKSIFAKFNRTGRFEFLRMFLARHLKTAHRDGAESDDYICSFLVYLFKEELNECFAKQERFYFDGSRCFTTLFNMLFKDADLIKCNHFRYFEQKPLKL